MKPPADQTVDEWRSSYSGESVSRQPSTQSVRKEPSRAQDEADGSILDSEPLIPEGCYFVKYQGYSTVNAGSGKLVIEFVISTGEWQGAILRAFFPVELHGKPGKFGAFKAKRTGIYFEQICELFPDLTNRRADRISPHRLQGLTIKVNVTTVKTKWNGEERKLHTQYSKVKELLSIHQSIP